MWRPDHTVQNPSHFSSSSPSFSDPIGGAAAGGSLVGAPPSPATGMAVPWSCARARRLPFSFRPPPFLPRLSERWWPIRLTGGGGGAGADPLAGARARSSAGAPPSSGLASVPKPACGAAARVFFPHAEAMARRRADALAFLSTQPWTAMEQQQVRALCSFFVRVSDCFHLSNSIRDRVASCSVSVSVDSQTNPFQIDLLDRSALIPLLDYRDRLGCRSNWRNSHLWVKPLFAMIRGAAVEVDEVAPELEKRSWTSTSLCRGTGVVVQWWRQWSIPSLATLP